MTAKYSLPLERLETRLPDKKPLYTEAEARARCMGVKLNRGYEAAQAALALSLSGLAKGSR